MNSYALHQNQKKKNASTFSISSLPRNYFKTCICAQHNVYKNLTNTQKKKKKEPKEKYEHIGQFTVPSFGLQVEPTL